MNAAGDVPPNRPTQPDRFDSSDPPVDAALESEAAWDARIADLRARIADDTYLTPDKLEAVIEGLHRELFGR